MKIKFDPNQNHQRRAWESAVGVFEGQELNKTTFSMPSIFPDYSLFANQTDYGFGNRLKLLDEELQDNVRKIQLGLEFRTIMNGFIKGLRAFFVPLEHSLTRSSTV